MAVTPPYSNTSVFNEYTLKNAQLYIPTGSIKLYESVDPWRNFWNILEGDYSNINSTKDIDLAISIGNGCLTINNYHPTAPIYLYDVSGKIIYKGYDNTIKNLQHGTYIMRIESKSMKIKI